MPKRLKKDAPTDLNQFARYLVDLTTDSDPELPPKPRVPKGFGDYMSKLGKRGGIVSGSRRMTNLTAEQRREIASKAARARWAQAKNNGAARHENAAKAGQARPKRRKVE
jgi:hypothetical protein